MLLALKLISLLIAASGGALALLGETRSKRRLTNLGKLSLLFLVWGLTSAAIVEVISSRTQSIDKEWSLTKEQPIHEVKFAFYYNSPMPVSAFARFLQEFRFVFGTYAQLENDGPLVRYLEFETDTSKTSDVEDAILLHTRNRENTVLARGRPGSLKYRTGLRDYVSSINKKWNSWDIETVGIEIGIPFYKLGLGDNIRTVGDLAKLTGLSVYIPSNLSPHEVDILILALFTSDGQIFLINVMSLESGRFNRGARDATISGVDLLDIIRDQFFERGGRASIGTIFQ